MLQNRTQEISSNHYFESLLKLILKAVVLRNCLSIAVPLQTNCKTADETMPVPKAIVCMPCLANSLMQLACLNSSYTCFFRALIAGGGAPEIEVSIRLAEYARTLTGMEAYCIRAFAEALEVIPFTLAENAGLNPIATVTDLRNRHAQGEKTAGINVRKVK